MAVQRPNFLVVENDPNDAFFIKRALSRAGSAHVCTNPEEARAYLSGAGPFQDRTKFPFPELILSDLRMEQHCGINFVQWLRMQPSPIRDTHIVILTGSTSPEDCEAARNAGAQKVLQKPGTLEDLQKLLYNVTEQFCPTQDK